MIPIKCLELTYCPMNKVNPFTVSAIVGKIPVEGSGPDIISAIKNLGVDIKLVVESYEID